MISSRSGKAIHSNRPARAASPWPAVQRNCPVELGNEPMGNQPGCCYPKHCNRNLPDKRGRAEILFKHGRQLVELAQGILNGFVKPE
jgi:hypothetical protein